MSVITVRKLSSVKHRLFPALSASSHIYSISHVKRKDAVPFGSRFSSSNKKGKRGRRFLKWTLGSILAATAGYYTWKFIEKATRPTFPNEKKKVVILGSGWSAVSVINHLNPGQFDITVVSPRNYFLFTPILPSVTVGTVESRSIVEPIRKLIYKSHKGKNVQFFEAECKEVDAKNKSVWCRDESGIQGSVSDFKIDYDILVVAVGAGNNTFNTPGVEKNCFFLKEMEDARHIRDTMIDLIESASYPGQSEEERKRLLRFIIVGGGPTGVEFASELRDFLREDIPKLYPNIPSDFKVSFPTVMTIALYNHLSEIRFVDIYSTCLYCAWYDGSYTLIRG